RYVLRLLSGAVNEVGWEVSANESVIRAQQRVDLLASACHFEYVNCLENAVRMYANWMLAPNPDSYNEINVDLRGIVYCVGVRAGGLREWQFAHARLAAASASERHRLLSVLGCTTAPHLLHRYLELSLRNDSGIRKQDVVRVFSAVAGTAIGQPIAFNFVRANWLKLRNLFVTESCSDLGRPVQQVLETVAANVQWRERNYQAIVGWLLEHDRSTNTS
ncbi:Protease m1 zinc metalloprotease, partial [Operophtera brumata]